MSTPESFESITKGINPLEDSFALACNSLAGVVELSTPSTREDLADFLEGTEEGFTVWNSLRTVAFAKGQQHAKIVLADVLVGTDPSDISIERSMAINPLPENSFFSTTVDGKKISIQPGISPRAAFNQDSVSLTEERERKKPTSLPWYKTAIVPSDLRLKRLRVVPEHRNEDIMASAVSYAERRPRLFGRLGTEYTGARPFQDRPWSPGYTEKSIQTYSAGLQYLITQLLQHVKPQE